MDEIRLPSAIHDVVSTSKMLAESFETTLENSESTIFSMKRETLEEVCNVLKTDAELIKHLYEENTSIGDHLTRIVGRLEKKGGT